MIVPDTPAEAIAQANDPGEVELSKKMRGTTLELEFALKCINLGYLPSMTFGDDAHYDIIVEKNGRYVRVNLKKASPKAGGETYSVNISRKIPKDGKSVSVPYKEGELDAIVSKIDDEWFLFGAVHAMPDSVEIAHSRSGKKCKWNSAREAWDVLNLDQ